MEELDKSLVEKIRKYRTLEYKFSDYSQRPEILLKPKKPKREIEYDSENFSVFTDDEPSDYWYWIFLLPPFFYVSMIFEFFLSLDVPTIFHAIAFVVFILLIKSYTYITRYSTHNRKISGINEVEKKYQNEIVAYKKNVLEYDDYLLKRELYDNNEFEINIANQKREALKQEIIKDFRVSLNNLNGIKILNGKLAERYKIKDIMSHYVQIKSANSRGRADIAYRAEKLNESLQNHKSEKNSFSIKETQFFFENEISQIIERTDLDKDEKVDKIINIYSWICATIAIQPIPFADLFILSPIQIIMGEKIGKIRGYSLLNNSPSNILKEITGALGLGILAQQIAIGAYKTIIPFYGAVTTIPMVYGLTYGIGQVMDYYILTKMSNSIPNKEEMKKIYKQSEKEGKKIGKAKEKEI
jgi:uncharacterized protein (DUF697 family)